ncbi:hypothetical protein SAMN04487970_10182 [Paenibacillus tianmuensis]|uniref:Uncharacterized protein n=1 Tax=Paenibacillus tianmuensis TaxID=624147 RepID=A0A1G4RPR2_9BACL|nr:hypothetical protein SAMN04487970_10182 [Paenibacillus tianmuensis]
MSQNERQESPVPGSSGGTGLFFIRGSIGKPYGPWDRAVRTAGRPTYVIQSSVLHRRADGPQDAQYEHRLRLPKTVRSCSPTKLRPIDAAALHSSSCSITTAFCPLSAAICRAKGCSVLRVTITPALPPTSPRHLPAGAPLTNDALYRNQAGTIVHPYAS